MTGKILTRKISQKKHASTKRSANGKISTLMHCHKKVSVDDIVTFNLVTLTVSFIENGFNL